MQSVEPHPPSPESLARGYEQSDASPKGLGLFVLFFLLVAVVLHVALWVLLRVLLAQDRPEDAPPSVLAGTPPRFVGPPLQPSPDHNYLPQEDMARLKARENDLFGRMGWNLDPRTGMPAIPGPIVRQVAERRRGGGG